MELKDYAFATPIIDTENVNFVIMTIDSWYTGQQEVNV